MTLSNLLCALPAYQRVHTYIDTQEATQFIGYACDVPARFEDMVILVIKAHRNDLIVVLAQL